MKKLLRVIGYSMIVLGALGLVYLQMIGINMTAGQSFIKNFPYWILVAGLMFGGYGIVNNVGKS